MKFFGLAYIALFCFTTVFILFFFGFYLVYTFYYAPYFQSSYEWYAFGPDKEFPSKIKLYFSGFKSVYLVFSAAVIALILSLVSKGLKTFKEGEWKPSNILFTSSSWTILFSAFYCIYLFSLNRLINNFATAFSLQLTKEQLPFFITFYFLLITPVTWVLYSRKRIAHR